MSLSALAVVLSSLGGASELAGLTLVVREIADDRERGRRLLKQLDESSSPERSYPGPVTPSMSPPDYANPAYASSMHVKGVVADLQRLQASVANALVGLKRATDAELDRAMERMQSDVAARHQELREGLRYVLAGSTRTRLVGATLLALGIVLSVVGSVISTIA